MLVVVLYKTKKVPEKLPGVLWFFYRFLRKFQVGGRGSRVPRRVHILPERNLSVLRRF